MMDCSGVRNSWLMLAMNSDFTRDASSAASLASRIARSARRNSDTSVSVNSTPVTWRRSPGTTTLDTTTSRQSPSRSRSCVS